MLWCRIQELSGLLQHREQVLAIVESEAEEVAAKFGSPRRTVMSVEASSSMSVEDIIPNSQSLVVFSRKGYIKRIPADTFSVQHRGGRGGSSLCHSQPLVFACITLSLIIPVVFGVVYKAHCE